MRVLILLLLSMPAWGAITFTQGVAASGATGNPTVTIASTASGATMMFAIMQDTNSAPTGLPSCTGATCTFTAGPSHSANFFKIYTWYLVSAPSGATAVTVAVGDSRPWAAVVAEVSMTGTIDQVPAGAYNTGSSGTSPSLTTTVANEIVFACWAYGNARTAGPDSSYTNVAAVAEAQTINGVCAYQIVSSTGTYTSTLTTSAGDEFAKAALSISDSGGGGPVLRRRPAVIW